MVTFQQLRSADLNSIGAQSTTWGNVVTTLNSLQTSAKNVGDTITGGSWEGTSAFAAVGRASYLQTELREAETEVTTVKGLLDGAKNELSAQKTNLDTTVQAVHADARLTITDAGVVKVDTERMALDVGDGPVLEFIQAQQAADGHNENIKKILAWVSLLDAQTSEKLRAAVNLDSPNELDFNSEAKADADNSDLPGPANPEIAAAQAAAFEKTLGRRPVSETDWMLAAAMDPTTHLDKFDDTDANVSTWRITPQPGQGLVRVGLYIPTDEVFNPKVGNMGDLGDNRGMDSNFTPDSSKVSLFVDYETGTVVARQSPSVDNAGNVEAGPMNLDVSQSDDGSVRIKYDAANGHAPPGTGISGHTVNGEVTVAPPDQSGQPARVSGTIGDYPSFEAYHETNGGPTTTLAQDEADNSGKFGPLLELPGHHDIDSRGSTSPGG